MPQSLQSTSLVPEVYGGITLLAAYGELTQAVGDPTTPTGYVQEDEIQVVGLDKSISLPEAQVVHKAVTLSHSLQPEPQL